MPSNVKITPDGTVKVLNFGLAKAMADESSTSAPADSPTPLDLNVDSDGFTNFGRAYFPGTVLGRVANAKVVKRLETRERQQAQDIRSVIPKR